MITVTVPQAIVLFFLMMIGVMIFIAVIAALSSSKGNDIPLTISKNVTQIKHFNRLAQIKHINKLVCM